MKRLNPNRIHIGMVRYADSFHPTNDVSQERLKKLEEKLHCEFENGFVPRSMKVSIARLALENGFEIHWFEKGLGR